MMIKWFMIMYGRYTVSALGAYAAWELLESSSIYLKVLAAVTLFLVFKHVLIAVEGKGNGVPIWRRVMSRAKIMAVGIITYSVVGVHYLTHGEDWVKEAVVFLIYLGIIVFFSRGYFQQMQVNHKASEQFIRLFESRMSNQMEGHGERVGFICEKLLETVPYPKDKINDLIQASIVHDIGKVVLPPQLLQKRGAFTLSEEKEFQAHSEKGAEIVRNFLSNPKASAWILHHHERYDGKGYPEGLAGTNIPMESRIIAVCNELDILMFKYKDDQIVFELLQEMSGKSLDPSLVSAVTIQTIRELRERFPYLEKRESPKDIAEQQEEQCEKRLQRLGQASLLTYYDNTDRMLGMDMNAPYDEIKKLAKLCWQLRKPFHEVLTYEERVFEAHYYPEDAEVRIFLLDITPMVQYERKIYNDSMKAYKDVIETLSHQKITICLTREELKGKLGTFLGSMDILTTADVGKSRAFTSGFLKPTDPRKLMNMKLAVSEGVTNLIKHAADGKVSIYESDEGMLQVLVSDQGSGIPLHELPKTILISGYSSKRSLGKGFSLMYVATDRMSIHTSAQGTWLLLEFETAQEKVAYVD
ncbi:HD domain-containing phosphohydrolase [Paenibacillus turpanensis]|uniref:HD domain-containing phosphohydrolase n=1 Tax=Paenibacillus turpanensis TaxID=2689078 RepID=UPI0014082BD7|nr:HD domain-containing phosphohydrolase [Paenibacillus turpanensis]